MDAFLGILFRWFHVIPACLAVGGVFFMRIVLPVGLAGLRPEDQKAAFLKCRRVFKMTIHTSILLFLVSGTYNAIANWPKYHQGIPASHAFFGLHVLLAVAVIGVLLVILAPKDPTPEQAAGHKRWMAITLALLMFTVAAASVLKWVRDHTPPAASPMVRDIAPTASPATHPMTTAPAMP